MNKSLFYCFDCKSTCFDTIKVINTVSGGGIHDQWPTSSAPLFITRLHDSPSFSCMLSPWAHYLIASGVALIISRCFQSANHIWATHSLTPSLDPSPQLCTSHHHPRRAPFISIQGPLVLELLVPSRSRDHLETGEEVCRNRVRKLPPAVATQTHLRHGRSIW